MRSFGVHMYLFAIPFLSSLLNNNYKVCIKVFTCKRYSPAIVKKM